MFLPLGDDIDKRSLPLVGCFLVGINLLVYLYEARLWHESLPDGKALIEFITAWGLIPQALAQGAVYGLFSHMFLHGDVFHLLGNMLMLWAFVGTLERALGPARFLLLYLVWGIAGGVAHASTNWDSAVPMIGASGAISGMIGAYFVAFGALTKIRTLVWLIFKPVKIDVPAGLFVFFWFISQLTGMEESRALGEEQVAWLAHIGGFAAGALTMLFFSTEIKNQLVLTREGAIQFADAGSAGGEAPSLLAEVTAENAPPSCSHCGTSISMENQIHARLLRCPNPSCGRLVYLT